MVVRASPEEPWRVVGHPEGEEARVEVTLNGTEQTMTGEKRARSPSHEDGPQIKRVRASPSENVDAKEGEASKILQRSPKPTSRCLAPPPNKAVQRIFAANDANAGVSDLVGTGDVFLTQGFRDRWCRCSDVWFLY